MKKSCILQLAISVIIPLSSMAQTSTAWRAKVDPVVLKKAETEPAFEFVAILKQQADLSAADQLETKEEKGTFVFNSLKAAAVHSQNQLTTLLTSLHATFRPFWVVNCVLVTADAKTLEAVANLASVESIIENGKYTVSKTIISASKDEEAPAAIAWGVTKTKVRG